MVSESDTLNNHSDDESLVGVETVSYTHLDVYKRQYLPYPADELRTHLGVGEPNIIVHFVQNVPPAMDRTLDAPF